MRSIISESRSKKIAPHNNYELILFVWAPISWYDSHGMNALFDEQNSLVVEYAAEAIIPIGVDGFMSVQHECLDEELLEQVFSGHLGKVHYHYPKPFEEGGKNV